MFDMRWLETDDYDELVTWWKDWRWTPPTREMLPNNGLGGVIISKDGVNICAGFLYVTNSNFALLEFIISNKNYRNKDRKIAIEQLIDSISETAKSNGFKNMFTSLKNQNLRRSFLNCGYVEGSTGTSELIKKL